MNIKKKTKININKIFKIKAIYTGYFIVNFYIFLFMYNIPFIGSNMHSKTNRIKTNSK